MARKQRRLQHIRKYASDSHLNNIEPLSVTAFVNAILNRSTPRPALALDVGSNIGTYTLFAAALGASVVAVDMQPLCAHVTACQLARNNLSAEVINAYVAPSTTVAPVEVPVSACSAMASPSATAGRWPHGAKLKANFLNQTESKRQLVPPIDIAAHLLANNLQPTGSKVTVTKIDVVLSRRSNPRSENRLEAT